MSKSITIKWYTDDVVWRAEEMDIQLTQEEAYKILKIIEKNHDPEVGINWNVIDYYIDDYNEKHK